MRTATALITLLSWANVTVEAPPTPVPAGEGVDLHNPVSHMDITGKAYELYAAQYDGAELGRFIGSFKEGKPFPDNSGTVVGGAFAEDQAYKNPFGELVPVLRHFWDPTGGPYKGYMGNDRSVNRAQKYMTGGFGLDGAYDKTWKGRGDGAVALYRKGDKGRDGQVDRGARRNAGFTEDLLKEEASVLMPLAYDRVAALYVYFYKQVDQVLPKVTLKAPRSATSEVTLEASAKDEISGVDKKGYAFEAREWNGFKWSSWRPAARDFIGVPGALYSFRASALDAAGNRGWSAPRLWRAPESVSYASR